MKYLFDMILVLFMLLSIAFTAQSEDDEEDDDDDDDVEEVVQTSPRDAFTDPNDPRQRSLYAESMFKKLFHQHRQNQLQAVKEVVQFGSYEQRYKLVDVMLKQLFDVIRQAKENVTQWGIKPEDRFPENPTQQFTLSKIFENTALFGDLILRLPEIVHDLYDRKRSWQMFLRWSTDFCNKSRVFEGPSRMMLDLMSMEVNFIPKLAFALEPDRHMTPGEKEVFKVYEEKERRKNEMKSGKIKIKKVKKGPRLSTKVEL